MKRLIAAVALSSVALSAFALEIGKPYEELAIERALPNIAVNVGSASTGGTQAGQSVWANDYNFVAPAQ
jgi:hypothetical protein